MAIKKREMVYRGTEGSVCVGVVNACIMIHELTDILVHDEVMQPTQAWELCLSG